MQIHKIFFGKNKSQHVQIKLPNNCNILCNKSLKVIYIDIITGWTPLLQASWHGKTEVAKILLENGADIEAKNEYGKIIYVLLIFCLCLLKCNTLGETSLFNAAFWGNTELASLFLKSGANVNVKNNEGTFFNSF